MNPVWGIDLGGTKIEGVIIDSNSDDLKVIERMRVPTEKDLGYEHIIGQIQKLIQQLSDKTNLTPSTIGIGTPGAIEPSTGLLKNCNATVLNGMPFKKDIEERLGIPIEMANDANCFAMAEAKLGVVKEHLPNARTVFGIIMGSGVGGGIVIDGKALGGLQGIAGEWGHNFLDESGGRCYCGKIGCVETVLSGPALERYYASISGIDHKLRSIMTLYQGGNDPYAKQTIDRMIHFFGMGVSTIINFFDPDAIVLGGGVGNIDLLYTEGVKSVEHFVFNSKLETPILKPTLGDSAGVFGAALLTV